MRGWRRSETVRQGKMRWERQMKRDMGRVSTSRILYMLGSRWMAEIRSIEMNGHKK
jgi:hypothetical protein